MGKVSGVDSRIYIAGYDLSGSHNKISPAMSRELSDVSCFSDSGHRYMPLFQNDEFTLSGFWEGGAGEIDEVMQGLINQYATLWHCVDGEAVGDRAYCLYAVMGKYTINSPVNGIVLVDTNFKGSGMIHDCTILAAKPTNPITVDGDGGVGLDGLAASASGAAAYLQVFECGADDNLIITIEDDDNDSFSSPNTLITFTTANGITDEIKEVTGAVQRHVRAVWNGSEPWSAKFAVAFHRIPD